MTGELDCRSCGACCISEYVADAFVYVDDDDIRRLTPRYRLHVIDGLPGQDGGELATKTTVPRRGPLAGADVCSCVALRGTPGMRVSCSIYDRRPHVCREYRPGSASCKTARRVLEEQRA